MIRVHTTTVQDGSFWYTQGREIDYGAQGDTAQESFDNFVEGLRMTLELNTKKYGSVDHLEPVADGLWADDQKRAVYHADVTFTVSGKLWFAVRGPLVAA